MLHRKIIDGFAGGPDVDDSNVRFGSEADIRARLSDAGGQETAYQPLRLLAPLRVW
jgi:hypothetical protein